jgi:asparagine synthase (glutamine-hydrolysing)
MAFSLESRLPFLDYRIVEFACRIKAEKKIKNGINKNLVRETFANEIPKSIINRKDKMGFVTPQKLWQRTVLKDFMKDIIFSKENSGMLNQKAIQRQYIEMEKTGYSDSFYWWRIFCFKYWYLHIYKMS